MIKSLELRNWKAYPRFRQEFTPGTTFIVARNGVGKSSIVQAIAFALFGGNTLWGRENSPVTNAVRGGEGAEAFVQLTLQLGNDEVVVRRTVTRVRRTKVQTAVQVNGQLASESDLRDAVRAGTGVDPTQLSMLAVVSEGQVLSAADAGVDIAAMLSETFGVDRLRDAAQRSRRRAGQIEREADELRKSLRDVPLRQAQVLEQDLQQRLASLERERLPLRRSLEQARAQQGANREWSNYDQAAVAYLQAREARDQEMATVVDEWSRNLEAIMPVPLTDAATQPTLPTLLDAVEAEISTRREQRARLESAAEQAEGALVDLAAGLGVCPTCRRPLSGRELRAAQEENKKILESNRRGVVAVDEKLGILDRAQTVLRRERIRPAPAPPAEPQAPRPKGEVPDDQVLVDLEERVERLTEEIGATRAQIRSLQQDRQDQAASEALARRLVDMYRRAETGYALANTLNETAEVICAERIGPLTNEVQKRWSSVWRREPLIMDPTGALSLNFGEEPVPFSEFSGGQRTIAQILVRILALQMATRSPFLILDEPLEHLDPRNRRLLASLLVRASEGETTLRQVLVTTYEESVTRRLSTWRGEPAENGEGAFRSRVLQVAPLPE
jgi:DNA repair exonuclease SbcCD ATPase subunit